MSEKTNKKERKHERALEKIQKTRTNNVLKKNQNNKMKCWNG